MSGKLAESMSDSISSLCLVRECKDLEELRGVAFSLIRCWKENWCGELRA